MATGGILIAAATRPHPTEVVSGDVWHVDPQPNGCRIAVIDGLGHGPQATAAAERARDVLAASPELDAVAVLRRCHDALRGTRGAAIGIATIEPASGRLTYAGVGNVEARVIAGGQTVRLAPSRGIVGATLPTIRPVAMALDPGWTFLIHSDGVSDRFDLRDLGETDRMGIQELADLVLGRWGRATDDASIVVARPRGAPV